MNSISKICMDYGLTRYELARLLGVSTQLIYSWDKKNLIELKVSDVCNMFVRLEAYEQMNLLDFIKKYK